MLLKSEILNTVRKRIDEAKYIPDYSSYVILPNEGLVYSLKSNNYVGAKAPNGYWHCALRAYDGTQWNTGVHRVIWIAVNGDIPEGLEVNHIDENKSNNSIDNLNLLTRNENTNYGTRNKRAAKAISKTNTNNPKRSKRVGMYKDGVLIKTFPSTVEVQRQLGFDCSSIGKCCRGVKNYNSHKGFQWQYL